MTKLEFLFALRDKLSNLPKNELNERLNFYSEMIEDRIEEGLCESDAVKAVGTVEQISAQILSENPSFKTAKEKRKLKAWEIVLLSLGSPLWLSLGIALFAVIASIYVSVWAVVVSLWAGFAALGCGAVGGIFTVGVLCFTDNALTGVALVGASIVCAGVGIFWFLGCKYLTKAVVTLTKKILSLFKKGDKK